MCSEVIPGGARGCGGKTMVLGIQLGPPTCAPAHRTISPDTFIFIIILSMLGGGEGTQLCSGLTLGLTQGSLLGEFRGPYGVPVPRCFYQWVLSLGSEGRH